MTGFTFGGGGGATLGGEDGGTIGTVAQREAVQARLASIDERGFTYGGDGEDGAAYGGRHGALYGLGPPNADELLGMADGFALVVEPVPPAGQSPRNRFYTESGSEARADGTLDSISMTLEANTTSGARITLAATPDLYRLPLGDAVLGYAGERLFSGRVEPVEATSSGESATIELLGPLSRLDTGGVSVSYSGITHREALRQFYADEVAPRTDNRVRGVVETPRRDEQTAVIPTDSPLEASGTPLAVLDELHGAAGLTYIVAHGTRGDARVMSFRPGSTTPRNRTWEPNRDSITPKLDPAGYATDVVVLGARDPARAQRYRGTASVSDREARAITGGERITYQPEPDDSLTSDAACENRAATLLAERRASYNMTGSVDAPPAPVQPGRVYRVPSMDKAAPDALTPVSLPLQKAEYSFARGEATMSLSFESEQGIAGLLRRADRNARATGAAWAAPGLDMADGTTAWAYPTQYPHQYPTGGD